MLSRERVIKTLNQEEVDRIPRDLWVLPGILEYRKHELEDLLKRYPLDFQAPSFEYGKGKRCKGNPARVGHYMQSYPKAA